jgi:hypothetical protein
MAYAHMYKFMNKYTLGKFLQRFYPSLYKEFESVEDVYSEEVSSDINTTTTNNFLQRVSGRIGDELFNAIQDWKYNFILR